MPRVAPYHGIMLNDPLGLPIARRYLPSRLRLGLGRRARRRWRAATLAVSIALGAAACAAFGGQSGRLQPNLALPTLGGTQLWTDVAWDAGWKVQRHAWTEHARLLDPDGVRRAWGDERACRARLALLHDERALATNAGAEGHSARPRLAVLVHGLGRSHRSLASLEARLVHEGYEVLAFEYASTRAPIHAHAAALAGVLEGLPEAYEVSFVTHSLGGIVLRELTRDAAAPWRARHTLGRAVTLAAPHGGAEIAARTGRSGLARLVMGPAFCSLGDGTAAALPEPDLEFGTVVAVRGDGHGWNPWVAGDDDGLVAASEASLEGARDSLIVDVAHTFVMDDESVHDAVVRFLESGSFDRAH
jgi:hypothetical protein